MAGIRKHCGDSGRSPARKKRWRSAASRRTRRSDGSVDDELQGKGEVVSGGRLRRRRRRDGVRLTSAASAASDRDAGSSDRGAAALFRQRSGASDRKSASGFYTRHNSACAMPPRLTNGERGARRQEHRQAGPTGGCFSNFK
jgi:hypothetical protein